jgi:glycine oxidase
VLPPDILIIGAGAVGLASALELTRRGARVTLLDRGRSGAESTWAGGGILSPLLPWNYSAAVNALSEYSRHIFSDWCARQEALAGFEAEYQVSGMLVLPPFAEADAFAWCQRHGWRCEIRDSAALLSAIEARPALWLPDVAQARNPRLAQVLRAAALAVGVNIVETAAVTQLLVSRGRISCVQTTQGDFTAAAVVIAAGAWSGVLPGINALSERVFPVRGQMLLFKLPPESLPESLPTIVLHKGHYLIPRRDGHVLAGSTLEATGFDKSTTDVARLELLAFAGDILPTLTEQLLQQQWSGLRPGSPDNIPLISPHPDYSNLYFNSGHFRYGVTMAPGSAQLLADLIEDKSPAIAAAPYAFSGRLDAAAEINMPRVTSD